MIVLVIMELDNNYLFWNLLLLSSDESLSMMMKK